MKEIFLTGNPCIDKLPEEHLGGAVSYSAETFKKLGKIAHIIVKTPAKHPFLTQLTDLGIVVNRIPLSDNDESIKLVTFKNIYDDDGRRQQQVSGHQARIDIDDWEGNKFPDIPKDSVIFVAPILDEVDPLLFKKFKEMGHLVVAPQGYFRQADNDGKIHQMPWQEVNELSNAELVVLSDEDITFDKEMSEIYLNRIKSLCPLVVLTRGAEGLTVYSEGNKPIDIKSFRLMPQEIISPTGAGDSCAASYTWHYMKWDNPKEAGAFAALYPALKLMGISGIDRGINALPDLDQVEQFINDNKQRYDEFLKSNNIDNIRMRD